jgi:hypothetical protein
VLYVRYEAASANANGRHAGIFALANGLARKGLLNPADWAWWRANNDWFEAAYVDPAAVDPTIFDKEINPHTSCWFKSSALHLLARVPGYLALLDRHNVRWTERRSPDPGLILYGDADQVVVVPKASKSERALSSALA